MASSGETLIRDEIGRDLLAIRALHRIAFGEDSPGRLVDELRKSGHAVISQVAERDRQVVGHVLFSRIEAPMRALTLAPVGVNPTFQGCGIGSSLIRKGLEQAAKESWQAVFVLGNPPYYERFGFSTAAAQSYTGPYSGPNFMVRFLDRAVVKTGVLVFPRAFDEDVREHQAHKVTREA